MADEDELQLEEEQALPLVGESGTQRGWGTTAVAAAPAAPVQQLLAQPQRGLQEGQPQGISPGAWQPSRFAAPAISMPGPGEAHSLRELSISSSVCPPPGFRPIVRPSQADSGITVHHVHPPAQTQQQQQHHQVTKLAQQRPPLQPHRHQPARQPAVRPAAVCGASNAGAWKAPSQLRLSAGKDAGTGRPEGAAPATSGPAFAAGAGSWNRLVDGVVQLGWPAAEEAARPARRVAIPDAFASSQQYVQAWTNALLEELNLRQVLGVETS